MREKVLSVTIHDCIVQTFRAGGPGGQNQNKRETGVRIIHPPSGAVVESREARTQFQNKKLAWNKLANNHQFRLWLNQQAGVSAVIIAEVERDMLPHNLLVEKKVDGQWVPFDKED